jgi:hypothetical protein
MAGLDPIGANITCLGASAVFVVAAARGTA